jgi:DNA-binding transcriptional regulator YdaS (Cro superfamily)
MSNIRALERAIQIADGQSELARRMRASGSTAQQQHISHWLKRGEYPAHEVIHIARAVSFEVTPHELDEAAYPNVWDGLPAVLAKPLLSQQLG